MNPRALIEVKNIGFRYPPAERPVIEDISFSVMDRDFVGIIGPNGSGKTTLLRLLSRVAHPQTGSVEIEGRNINSFTSRDLARIMAVVPQFSEIIFPFTAFEIVLMGRHPFINRFRNETRHDLDAAIKAMELTETLELKHRIIRELSGGERQRVILARALAQEPKILLLDEPAAHLDIKHQVRIHELLRSLNSEQNLCVVMISHDLNFAAEYCRNLALLEKGRIRAFGSPHEVLDENLIQEVYQTRVMKMINPRSGRPYFLLPGADESHPPPHRASQ